MCRRAASLLEGLAAACQLTVKLLFRYLLQPSPMQPQVSAAWEFCQGGAGVWMQLSFVLESNFTAKAQCPVSPNPTLTRWTGYIVSRGMLRVLGPRLDECLDRRMHYWEGSL